MKRLTFMLLTATLVADTARIPGGFKKIFNGKDLKGWHISTVSRHGNSQDWIVKDGVLSGGQDKPGNGGILVTNRKYKNYEIYMELYLDWGCDGGLFLRSTEEGQAYQVQINYLPNDYVGGISGEALGPNGATIKMQPAPGWEKLWKKGEWNSLRARIEGDVPHITVWINGAKLTDWTDTENHLIGGAVDGKIALQVHGGTGRWASGGRHKFRNIALKEL